MMKIVNEIKPNENCVAEIVIKVGKVNKQPTQTNCSAYKNEKSERKEISN